jgi:hypothetical protein
MPTVSEQLRKALKASGESMYAVSKATGINTSVLSRFVMNGAGLRSENLDILAAYLGLALRPVKGGGKRGTKAKGN